MATTAPTRPPPPTAPDAAATTSDHLRRPTRRHAVGLAERELGDPLRWSEIYQLNEGRSQPGGVTLTDPHWIDPGWTLRPSRHRHTIFSDTAPASTPPPRPTPPSAPLRPPQPTAAPPTAAHGADDPTHRPGCVDASGISTSAPRHLISDRAAGEPAGFPRVRWSPVRSLPGCWPRSLSVGSAAVTPTATGRPGPAAILPRAAPAHPGPSHAASRRDEERDTDRSRRRRRCSRSSMTSAASIRAASRSAPERRRRHRRSHRPLRPGAHRPDRRRRRPS